jgi:hypothetical protein
MPLHPSCILFSFFVFFFIFCILLNKGVQTSKKLDEAGHGWLTPVILATQEAEIRRITIQSQARANSSKDPISKILNTSKGWQNGSSGRASALAIMRP